MKKYLTNKKHWRHFSFSCLALVLVGLFLVAETEDSSTNETMVIPYVNTDRYDSPKVVIYDYDKTNPFCQGAKDVVESFEIAPDSDGHLQFGANQLTAEEFCVSVQDIPLALHFFYGPYVNNDTCSFTIKDSNTREASNVAFFVDKNCFPPTYIQNTFTSRKTETTFVRAYERGESDDCEEGSYRGDIIAEGITGAGLGGVTLAFPKGTEFCLQTRTFENVEHVHHYFGPFVSNPSVDDSGMSSTTGCQIEIHVDVNGHDYYKATDNCFADNYVIFNNKNKEKNYDVLLRDAEASSNDCSDQSGDISRMKVLSGTSRALIPEQNGEFYESFCLALENGRDRGYHGPFKSKKKCEIDITDHVRISFNGTDECYGR